MNCIQDFPLLQKYWSIELFLLMLMGIIHEVIVFPTKFQQLILEQFRCVQFDVKVDTNYL